jgi:hypothetical protein
MTDVPNPKDYANQSGTLGYGGRDLSDLHPLGITGERWRRAAPDPVAIGLVASFSKPGGNATGFSIMAGETEPKLLGLLHELLPGAKQFAELVLQINEERATNLRRAAAMIGAQIAFLQATNIREIDLAFAELAQKHVDALLVSPPPFSLTVPCKSRRLPHATPYPPFISSANSQRWAA